MNRGIIKLLLIFIIASLVAAAYGLDVRGFVESHPTLKENLLVIWFVIETVWEEYVVSGWQWLWGGMKGLLGQ